MLKPIFVTATNLADAWFQLIYKCVEKGRQFTIDRGSYAGQKRCEFDFATIHITHPGKGDLLPQLSAASGLPNPVEQEYIDSYLPYLMTGEEKENEAYTYGQRICEAKLFMDNRIYNEDHILIKELDNLPSSVISKKIPFFATSPGVMVINQMELMIWTYKNKGYRNNQMIMQIGAPSDMLLQDPPCLRHIDTRIQDGKLHFYPYFRSWDLYGGLPANLAAIELMKQYCAAQIGVENGEIIASSKGLHIYDYVFEIAEQIRGRSMAEFRTKMEK